MKPTTQQQKAYLKAIGMTNQPEANLESLIKIVEAHIQTFPFETINLHDSALDDTRHKIDNTNFNYVFEHLVSHKRGGHCVALNTLLQSMLIAFGFEVKPIAPDTIWQCDNTPKDKRLKHCAAIVTVQNQEYLVDAGFGGVGLLSPILLKPGEAQQYSEKFKIIYSEDYPYELQLWDSGWRTIYGVPVEQASNADYKAIDAVQSDPLNDKCHFSSLLLCTKPVIEEETGCNKRYRICNNKFSTYKGDELASEKEITDQKMLGQLLKKYFGISLGKRYIRFQEEDFQSFQLKTKQPSLLHDYPTRRRQANATQLQLLSESRKSVLRKRR